MSGALDLHVQGLELAGVILLVAIVVRNHDVTNTFQCIQEAWNMLACVHKELNHLFVLNGPKGTISDWHLENHCGQEFLLVGPFSDAIVPTLKPLDALWGFTFQPPGKVFVVFSGG